MSSLMSFIQPQPLPNNIPNIEDYLPDPAELKQSRESEAWINWINEKNNLIEQYKDQMLIQDQKYLNEITKLSTSITDANLEISNLKHKISSISSSELLEWVAFYETQIENIITTSKDETESLKKQISLLAIKLPPSNTGSNNSWERLKKVVDTLMKENTELKDKNKSLAKITRMNETYKSLNKIYIDKINEIKNNSQAVQKEQTASLNKAIAENKAWEDENAEQKKVIKNWSNTIEYLKSKKSKEKLKNSSNTNASSYSVALRSKRSSSVRSPNVVTSVTNALNTEVPSAPTTTTRKIVKNYADNHIMIELDNLQLDKYLNSIRIIVNDKVTNIKKQCDNILAKVIKEKSIYLKIIKKSLDTLVDDINYLHKETATVLKKAHSSFNVSVNVKNVWKDIIGEAYSKSNDEVTYRENNTSNMNKYLISEVSLSNAKRCLLSFD